MNAISLPSAVAIHPGLPGRSAKHLQPDHTRGTTLPQPGGRAHGDFGLLVAEHLQVLEAGLEVGDEREEAEEKSQAMETAARAAEAQLEQQSHSGLQWKRSTR